MWNVKTTQYQQGQQMLKFKIQLIDNIAWAYIIKFCCSIIAALENRKLLSKVKAANKLNNNKKKTCF